jgi:hypothetical protein
LIFWDLLPRPEGHCYSAKALLLRQGRCYSAKALLLKGAAIPNIERLAALPRAKLRGLNAATQKSGKGITSR